MTLPRPAFTRCRNQRGRRYDGHFSSYRVIPVRRNKVMQNYVAPVEVIVKDGKKSWFDGVVGYRICLTHRRSSVRARVEPVLMNSFCYYF
ncbi:hypothetical protein GYMLUDRAFT_924408 [Collybiopsis luxurians FD-317 M1]|uniref:Uncharacterized protein n=1 Tax=Collybiopsis luxurians FD-317 M1 TaxID=944289 RepID=A0A0D0BGM6_9AGAR|nr:hypothetical protein GYMLUDRAFT_924408 [Collybiopsis luxurians FD-317 M1]